MDLGIAGKRALVCAASKGLGRGCALALAREGVHRSGLAIFADHHHAGLASGGLIHAREGLQQLGNALALETGAHQQEHHGIPWHPQACAHRFVRLLSQSGMKMRKVHTVVDHLQLVRNQAVMRLNFPGHHVRIADHCLEPGTGEQPALGGQRVAMPGAGTLGQSACSTQHPLAIGQPLRMHAVSGTKNVAAGDALMRLHQIIVSACDLPAGPASKAPVPPGAP